MEREGERDMYYDYFILFLEIRLRWNQQNHFQKENLFVVPTNLKLKVKSDHTNPAVFPRWSTADCFSVAETVWHVLSHSCLKWTAHWFREGYHQTSKFGGRQMKVARPIHLSHSSGSGCWQRCATGFSDFNVVDMMMLPIAITWKSMFVRKQS